MRYKIMNKIIKEEIKSKDWIIWKIWENITKERIQLSIHKMSSLFRMNQEASSHR